MDGAGPSVDRFRRVFDSPTENVSHPLQSETNAEYRYARFQQDLPADAEVALVLGSPRTGRQNDVVRREVKNLLERQFVVADDYRRRARDLSDELIEVVRKRIVVVDEQGLHETVEKRKAKTFSSGRRWPEGPDEGSVFCKIQSLARR
jgi:hypothetical protein